MNWRLHPRIFNPRWYPLILLRKNINKIISSFLDSSKNKVLLDFGCGDMPYKDLFTPHIDKYIGIDLPGNPFANLFIQPEGKIDIGDNSVDIVLSTQVLEHVENPSEYLAESYRVLKPKGILIISTHGYWIYHPTPNDYWRWTSSGLKKIIAAEGFEIKYFAGILGRSSTGLLLLQDSIIFKIPRLLVPFVALPLQITMLILDKIMDSQRSRDKDAAIYLAVCEAVK